MRSAHRAVAVVCLTALLCAWPARAQWADSVGIYHWGGSLKLSASDGINLIAGLGGHVARLVLSPLYYSEYGSATGCYPNYSLAALAQEPDIQRALDDPRINAFILTAYDGVSFGDCSTSKFLNPRFYTPANVAAMKAEYRDFVLYLFRRYAGSGRHFVISNWESDNAVYCNAMSEYASDPAFRLQCDNNYPSYYDGNRNVQDSLDGLRLWFETRQEGIAEGIRLAEQQALGGLEVVHAPEINSVRLLESNGFPSVLQDVLSQIHVDCVSYSAYEAANANRPADALAADIRTIRAATAADQIIIGEVGYSRSVWHDAAATRLRAFIDAAFASGVEYVVSWNLNDQDAAFDFGAFDSAGKITSTGLLLQTMFQEQDRASRPSSVRPRNTSRFVVISSGTSPTRVDRVEQGSRLVSTRQAEARATLLR